jgi:hypothetical protein
MTDDDVRTLLARQPHSETLPHPAETVAVLRQDVVDATDDSGAVERWIAARGGERRLAPAMRNRQAGDGQPRFDGPFLYYVVPSDALRP